MGCIDCFDHDIVKPPKTVVCGMWYGPYVLVRHHSTRLHPIGADVDIKGLRKFNYVCVMRASHFPSICLPKGQGVSGNKCLANACQWAFISVAF